MRTAEARKGPRAGEADLARGPGWPRTAVRVGFAIVWLANAYLKWLPAFQSNYLGYLRGAANGQPAWLQGWFHFWVALIAQAPDFFVYATAVLETYLAFALLVGFALKFTYTLGALYSLLLWLVPEHFGTPYAPGTAYVGTAIIYTFVFLALLAPKAAPGLSPHSVDAALERRISWWHRLADA